MEAAKTILEQLGGRRFIIMTGTHNLVAGKNELTMKLRRNSCGASHLRVTLTPLDLYRMEFIKVRKGEPHTVTSFDGIYADQLQDIFESITGLYTKP